MLFAARTPVHRASVHVVPSYSAARPRILCATDLSSRSEHAIQRALRVCDAVDGQLMLLHVVGDDVPMRLAGRRAERAHTALRWQVKHLRDLKHVPDVSVRIGHPYNTIARAAREWGADLIVVGMHRKESMARFGYTTAERIAHRSRRPVLVVNTEANREYCGVTFCARRSLERFVQLADRFDLYDVAHVAVALPRSPLHAIGHAFAAIASMSRRSFAVALRERAHQRVQRMLEDTGMHLLGFEIVGGRPTPRRLLARIKQANAPQLLVVDVDRMSLVTRALPRTTALLALRSRACDVLIAPAASARRTAGALQFVDYESARC